MSRLTVSVSGMVRTVAMTAFPNYPGRKIKVDWSGSVQFRDTNWGGGTKNTYVAVEINGAARNVLHAPAPWLNPLDGKTVVIPNGWAVVEHSIFCGRDLGLRVYYGEKVGPEALPALARERLNGPEEVR